MSTSRSLSSSSSSRSNQSLNQSNKPRLSNDPANYAYPNTSIHPLVVNNKPRFVTITHERPLNTKHRQSIHYHREAPRAEQINPLGNAPIIPITCQPIHTSINQADRARAEAQLMADALQYQQEIEQQRKQQFDQSVKQRLRAHRQSIKQAELARMKQLPADVRLVLYGDQNTENAPINRSFNQSMNSSTTDCGRDSELHALGVSGSSRRTTHVLNNSGAWMRVGRPLMTQEEERAYARRIRLIESERERMVIRERAQRAANEPRRPSALPAYQPLAQPNTVKYRGVILDPSRRLNQTSTRTPTPESVDETAQQEKLQKQVGRALSSLDIKIAPLCPCSFGNGVDGTGAGIDHRDDCIYHQREREYMLDMLELIQELERANRAAHELTQT